MNRIVFLALTPFALFAADPLPSAESILDRFVAVTGGSEAYERRTSEIMHGFVDFPAVGLKGAVTTYHSPDGYYMTIDIAGLGKIESGVKDGIAWERTDLQGPRIKEGIERTEALRAARLDGALRWREIYPKAETIGEDTVDGEACYQVRKTPREGHPEVSCYSLQSGLELRMTSTATSQMGEVPGETLARKYKAFGGVSVPTEVATKAIGQAFTITVESVDTNPSIPASRFALPADVEALTKK